MSIDATLRLAWKNLFGDPLRFYSLTGTLMVAFLLLVNTCAIFFGIVLSFTNLPAASAAPVWVKDRLCPMYDLPTPMSNNSLCAVRSLPGVAKAEPYYHCLTRIRRPDGMMRLAMVIAVSDSSLAGFPHDFQTGDISRLNAPRAFAIDNNELKQLGNPSIGDEFELNNYRLTLSAVVDIKPNSLANPVVFMKESDFLSAMPPAGKLLSFLMVWPREGVSAEEVCQTINRHYPDLEALPQRDFLWMTSRYYLENTILPQMFLILVVIGLILSLTIVIQQLCAFIAHNLTALATMKALGFSDGDLQIMTVMQTLICGIFAYGFGVLIMTMEGVFFSYYPRMLFYLPLELLIGGMVILLAVCLISCFVVLRKLSRIEPMQVFRA